MTHSTASKRRGQAARLRPIVMALISAGCASAVLADTIVPDKNMVKIAGEGVLSVNDANNVMTLKQTSLRSIWEARSFSLSSDARFEVVSGNAHSMTMVRVTGFGRSSIDGRLVADNQFILVNPYGITVGGTAILSANSLVLSALDLKTSPTNEGPDYDSVMKGEHIVFDRGFSGYSTVQIDPGAKLSVAADGGLILIGDDVRNQGTLSTGRGGNVGLLAVSSAEVEVDVGDSGFIKLAAYTGDEQQNRVAINTGTIDAPAGEVTMVGIGGANFNGNTFSSDELYQSGFEGGFASGAFNSGTITAQGSEGQRGTVNLWARGRGSVAATIGKIDVSSLDRTTLGGVIRMSGETVRVGLYHDATDTDVAAQSGLLVADGPGGGGEINLGDKGRADGDTTETKWIYVSHESSLTADATDQGDGGSIRLHAMYDDSQNPEGSRQARFGFGQIEAYGNFSAQGGANGGSGGRMETYGQSINLSYNGMVAAINVSRRVLTSGVNGVWAVRAPHIRIGEPLFTGSEPSLSHYEAPEMGAVLDAAVISGVLRGGANVSLTATNDLKNNGAGTGTLRIDDGSTILSTGAGESRLDMSADTTIVIGAGTTIQASNGSLAVTAEAQRGLLSIEGSNPQSGGNSDVILQPDSTVQRLAQPLAVSFAQQRQAPVTIKTNGGAVTLSGNNQGAQETPPAGVSLSGLVLDTRAANGSGGAADSLTITGSATGGLQGVLIGGNTELSSQKVTITGTSQVGAGVRVGDTKITGNQDGIAITGTSLSAGEGGQGLGVDFASNTSLTAQKVTLIGNSQTGTGVSLNGTVIGATQGSILVQGSSQGGQQGGQGAGVAISGNANLTAQDVTIQGSSQTGTGVRLSDTTITGLNRGTIAIHGSSQSSEAGGQGVGVDIAGNVKLHARQGQATILGLAASGIGVRLDGLTVTTAGGVPTSEDNVPVRQRFTLAGQSNAGGSGITVVGQGVRLADENVPTTAATADVVVGATAGDSTKLAMDLGTKPVWNTTGRVNYRPLSLIAGESQSLQLVGALGQAIHVGSTLPSGAGTNFLVKPEWFNGAVNTELANVSGIVIGSAEHAGVITVADGALVGARSVTLQNQAVASSSTAAFAISAAVGEGGTDVLQSGGIVLGQQQQQNGAGVGQLNLLTNGNITQTGPITVGELNLVTSPSSSVQLTNPQNRITKLNYSGDARPSVSNQAKASSDGTSGVLAFSQGANNSFQLISLEARRPSAVDEIINQYHVPRPLEGPEVLGDLRTDVYVHGQLSRPQICTAASTASAGRLLDANGADPLSMEWTKVRRGAQLTNCSGVQAENSCSAF